MPNCTSQLSWLHFKIKTDSNVSPFSFPEFIMSTLSPHLKVVANQLPLDHISEHTPMGANILPSGSGATFKVWAPAAKSVAVLWQFEQDESGAWIF
jgi:hypothetical protein